MDALARARSVLARTSEIPAIQPLAVDDDGPAPDEVGAAPDPYWPKWHGPWWRLLLRHELGAPASPPAVEALVSLARSTWLPIFPRTQAELDRATADRPGLGFDGYRHCACFCALGGLAALAHGAGVDLDRALPWWRGWLVEYQLPDGGWNCDEAAHARAAPCSSIVSTAPILEALLDRHASLSPAERAALDRGVGYLLARSLVRSLRKDAVIDARWLAPAFPRFYGYDALRGLSLVTRWARLTGATLPAASIADVLEALAARVGPDGFAAGPNDLVREATTILPPQDGAGPWTKKHPVAVPPLLERARTPGACAPLERAWRATLADLAALDRDGRLA